MNNPRGASEATFRVGPLVNLAALLHSLGCNPDSIFKHSGFSPEEFDDPDHRLPYLRSSQLLAHCVEATNCDHLGLLLGQEAEPSHLGIAGFLVRAAPTVGQALNALVENLDLHDEGGHASLDIGSEYTCFRFALHLPGVLATEQIYDLSAAIMFNIMRVLCGPDWNASTIKLQRREPTDRELYRRFYHAPIFFNSTECAITFQSDCLKRKSPSADSLLFDFLLQEARQLHDLQHHELMEELPAVLMRGLLTEQFAARHIADTFGIHERTLHRRLQLAGTTFRQELDGARKAISEQLLGNTSLPVCDIANALGYADSSGFIRAFHRWRGISPCRWRRRNNKKLQ